VAWSLLASLSEQDRADVLRVARPRRYAKGEVIFHEGDPGESLHFVRSGRLVVRVSTEAGDTATLRVLSTGDAFGEMALIGSNRERTATVVALEESQTLALHRADFSALRQKHPAVEQLLVQLLARRVDNLSTALLEALYVGVDRRVIRRLADLATVYGAEGGTVVLRITQDDLAGMAGTTRPSVNQVLQRLAAEGMVRLGRGKIELTDLRGLQRRSGRTVVRDGHLPEG
jgi:CRP-like cAMP-binding protein